METELHERVIVRAIVSPGCNGTNRFTPGRWYKGVRSGFGYMVSLGDGSKRFVSADGSGGAHLIWTDPTNPRHVQIAGRFIIIADPEAAQ